MPPQMHRYAFGRKRKTPTPPESPPPQKVVTEEQILERGCPPAPRKKPPIRRKGGKQTGGETFFIIDPDEPAKPAPRRLLPDFPDSPTPGRRPAPRLKERKVAKTGQPNKLF